MRALHSRRTRRWWSAALLALALTSPVRGREPEREEPALPPGLEQPEELQEPSLPPGLGGEGEPALPPGLDDDDDGADKDEESTDERRSWTDRLPRGLHGFGETRVGPRIDGDPAHSESFTLAEIRLQADYERSWSAAALDAKGDLILDGVSDAVDTELRQACLTFRPAGSVDLRVGRQVMTWGTGDLLFINDLFPKDWRSFFIGRDEEYLKAPSDALRLGWFGSSVNLDLVYTPEFEADRFIRGERLSFFDPLAGGFVGDDRPLSADIPDNRFDDDEIALRAYGNAGSYEIAAYAYTGFWKSPAGRDPDTLRATFPALDVFGASARGPIGPGIGSVEIGYYASRDDSNGSDPFVDNGEMRFLAGYELELARELTGSFQYYLERLLDHDRYTASLPAGEPRDENRHVVTARLTKLLKNQTLIPSFFLYYSPSDRDGYLRPRLTYEPSDSWSVELGGNVFFGQDDHTFFAQFEGNSNLYAAVRFSL